MKWRGRRADTKQNVEITAADGVIRSVEPMDPALELPWVSPGWIDLQVNGFAGFDLNGETTTVKDVTGVMKSMWRKGVTCFFPTIVTGSFERIRQAMSVIGEACDKADAVRQTVAGIHLEGPYLSGEDGPRGAHDLQYIRDPDWDEFNKWQEDSGNRIRLVTIAPERPGAAGFIRKLVQEGIVVSIGHTNANTEQIGEAVQAGATMSTHLGNGAHPVLPRHPNYIWDQLAEDRLWATLIPDGHHLAPNVLKAMCRAKGQKVIFVSDGVKFGGLPPGRYRSSTIGSEVELHPNGRLNMAANPAILAGSAQSLDLGVATAMRLCGISMEEAVEAVSSSPALAMGLTGLGKLEIGAVANLTLFEYDPSAGNVRVVETVVHGETCYPRADAANEEGSPSENVHEFGAPRRFGICPGKHDGRI